MSQHPGGYDSDGAAEEGYNEVAASQTYDPEAGEGSYAVVLRKETEADPHAIHDEVLEVVGCSNALFHSALAGMLASHAALEHLRVCFGGLDADAFPALVEAAKNKFHAYLRAGSVDKTARVVTQHRRRRSR